MEGPFQDRELEEEEEDDWRASLTQRKAILVSTSAFDNFLWNIKSEMMGKMLKKGYEDKDIAEILELNEEEFHEMKRDL